MPSGVKTLAQIRLEAQRRADMENSEFLSTTEWNDNINSSCEELYDLLIQKYGDDYFVASPQTITTDGVNNLFSLPSDFYKLIAVDQLLSAQGSAYHPVERFNVGDRGEGFCQGAVPPAGKIVRLTYIPRFTELVNDTDTADGISGWLEYVIVDAAMKALVKEESDTSALEVRKDKLTQRIESAAENRDAGNPQTVVDVYSQRRRRGSSLRYRLQGNNLWLENHVLFAGITYGY